MQSILKTVFNFIRRDPGDKDDGAARFLAKSENFRLLLAANNEALELMAEMTGEAKSDTVFGMSHVRALTLKTAAAVRQMIERLCRMAPGKYDSLKDAFNRIVMDMDMAVDNSTDKMTGPLVLGMENISADSLGETGSKMALLGDLHAKLGIRVPMGFSITASAYRLFMGGTGLEDEINRLIQISPSHELDELEALEANIRNAIDLAPIPADIEDAVEAENKKLMAGNASVRLAVRSSALGEDAEGTSFAGQFLSLLGVGPDEVSEAYRSVVASMFSATAMAYRLNRGLREDGVVMCVGCLEMIDAQAGGVVYTRNPVFKDDGAMIVNATPGLPCSVVDGSALSDAWIIERDSLEIRETAIADKKWRHILATDGTVSRQPIEPESTSSPAISDELALQLAELGLRIEEHFGKPQDIEWALSRDGHLYILQSRPLSGCRARDKAELSHDEDAPFAILRDAMPASPGAATGRIFPVENDEDMRNFPDGAVLLARNARPRLSVLLPKAAAMIAEHGSPAGHLANVAREFSIPALVGAPDAMDRLSDVGVVTVNADTGTVYLGRREGQLDNNAEQAGPSRKSDMVMALERVLPFITPLSLTDPAEPEFSPEGCKSLHDITRFCHEKGVAEMFASGRAVTANARRLKGDLPMQYWLVDIGGGTADSGDERHIGLEEVRSNAMLALWSGMTAVHWDGPPPVNAGGFMSVIAEASRNPALTPGMANDMGERNYFTVGRNYCNLQARFGFHFCTVEGFAGNDPAENYALFQYRGGGADLGRRQSRIDLVARILERQGFIVESREDALYARMEGITREAAEQALAVVGYLLVHTRQIDMDMTGPKAMRRYTEKFDADIKSVLRRLPDGLEQRRRQ